MARTSTVGWLLRGAAAGAAGTTALNVVTYLDMAVRGRPASTTPGNTVEKLAATAHLTIPGDGATRASRVEGLGALTGLVAGIGVGGLFGLARASGFRAGTLLTTLTVAAVDQRTDDRSRRHRPAHLVARSTGSATSCRTWPTAPSSRRRWTPSRPAGPDTGRAPRRALQHGRRPARMATPRRRRRHRPSPRVARRAGPGRAGQGAGRAARARPAVAGRVPVLPRSRRRPPTAPATSRRRVTRPASRSCSTTGPSRSPSGPATGVPTATATSWPTRTSG